MACQSQPDVERYNKLLAPDVKTAKNAIAKAAKSLRLLLTDNDARLGALVEHGLMRDKNPKSVSKELQDNVDKNPALFWTLIREIRLMDGGSEAAAKLETNCPTAEYEPKPVLGDLWNKLRVMKDLHPTDEIIKAAIIEAVAKELKTAVKVDLITQELTKMFEGDLISSELLNWAVTETKKEHQQILDDSNVDYDTLLKQSPPVKLGDDDLYHASICSTVVNTSNDTQACKKLLQSLSYKSLQELSVSQSDYRSAFPRCMIASAVSTDGTNATTCYVAFENISEFHVWEQLSDAHKSTFGKVLESQIEKFPTLYLEAVIKKKNRLVLTGFSFGGVLAQMLAAQLWLLPHTSTDQLTSNVICITFGQPLIQSDLLTHVAESFPDFKRNVHAIGLEEDSLPSILEKLDSLTFTKEVKLVKVLENLAKMQEFCAIQEKSMGDVPSPASHKSTLTVPDEHGSSDSAENDPSSSTAQEPHSRESTASPVATNPRICDAQKELEKFLRSQHADPGSGTNFAATRYMIVCSDSKLKVIELDERLQESVKFNRMADLICARSFDKHTAGVYYSSIKMLAYNYKMNRDGHHEISSEFLCPSIRHVKVTQYGDDAIVVVSGQRLWFVHSLKLLSTIRDPFQVQDTSVSFKASMVDVVRSGEAKKDRVVVYSYFSGPIAKEFHVELNPNRLSPRGKQLASLEPARLLELGFMMALLEKSPVRFNRPPGTCSPSLLTLESPPFFTYFKQLLHEIVTVVPHESILCTVAHCQNKRTADLCTRIIKKLRVEFEFSLTTYASLFVAVFKIQHQSKAIEASMAEFLDRQPFEDCAYFMWLKAKYMKSASSKPAVDSFSEEVFSDPYIFGTQQILCDDALYFQRLVQSSLKPVQGLSQVNAVSSKSAADLYKWNSVYSSSRSKQEVRSLKSPVTVLIDGREVLHQSNALHLHPLEETSVKPHLYEKSMEVLHNARGGQFDLCIGVLCGFMYQHVRVPFTEFNPMTFWKSLRHHIAPYSDVFKNDSEFWTSILKRCQRAISKGSQVVERTYDSKLKFLVNNIDPETKAHTTPTSSEYSIYTLEKKLKQLCALKGITKEKSIDRIMSDWRAHFKDCPMINVALSHRALVCQWIKWSLMIHELRLMLETHVTIAIPGLVNSGKTQLIRSLFGLDVKAGTTELRRTIVPFMYSLAPDVKGVHVVDLPGADDSDKNVSQLTEFLKFISQIVVFVVSYDKAHTKDAKKWLDMFEKSKDELDRLNKQPGEDYSVISEHHFESKRHTSAESNVPVLVCMTFADRLLAEMLDEDGKYNPAVTKKDIAKHFEDISSAYYEQGMWKPKGKRTLGYYCFNLSQSRLDEGDVKSVGIGVPSDVGEWICKQLREEIHEGEIADKLEVYFKNSSRKLKVQ